MKVTFFMPAFFAALTSCGTSTTTYKYVSETSTINAQTVCNINSVPAGSVIVGYTDDPLCPPATFYQGFWNAYTVAVASNGETVCGDSPVPNGFVEAAPTLSAACVIPIGAPAGYENAYVIQKL